MFNDNEFKAAVEGYPVTAKALEMVAHACAIDRDREASMQAVAADAARLAHDGNIRHAAIVLAYLAAHLLKHDEHAVEQLTRVAEGRGEFAAIVAECARQLAAEDGETFGL